MSFDSILFKHKPFLCRTVEGLVFDIEEHEWSEEIKENAQTISDIQAVKDCRKICKSLTNANDIEAARKICEKTVSVFHPFWSSQRVREAVFVACTMR